MMTVNEAILEVVDECSNEYAKTYAMAVPRAYREGGEHGKKVQVLYILSNITHWRGGRSKEVRKVLKEYTKGM